MAEPASRMSKMEGKVAIITGGASGIGEATARLFADNAVRAVVIADIQDEKGQRVAESIGLNRCSYIHCDVADEEQVIYLVNQTVSKHGRLDVMFSNAGIMSGSDQTLLDLDLAELDRVFAVNARGTAACVKQAARVMLERRVRGSIVCTASVAASRGGCWRTDYIMSKHAVVGLVRSASRQLGEHGIRVNCVSPSAVATSLQCRSEEELEEVRRIYEQNTSLKGIELTVRHVADAVLFLASDDSLFVTGHDLAVDGGLTKLPDEKK
ncbi:hypothetical protein RJ640_005366 [Escallonia rubra]|uniref:(-)-isopiperitenol/(-)-carveol dehydrogenase n=1 Tax=Escallonia rubra TaxID=112253 RepID=A0AA88UPL4_9ASTE|nr:hypothetical protein RJ640_005366 [Escallonia rubra]